MIQLSLINLIFLYLGGIGALVLVVGSWLVRRRRKRERADWRRHIVCKGCMNPFTLELGTKDGSCPHCGRINGVKSAPLL